MRAAIITSLLFFSLVLTGNGFCKNHYVSNAGDDNNPGTLKKPFKNIQKAANIMQPGDTCYIRGGVYREEVRQNVSGKKDQPIIFTAYKKERVVFDGADILKSKWTVYKDKIYQTKMEGDFEQLFVDDRMMIEARWPNMRFDQLFDQNCWAKSNVASRYGKMVSKEAAQTGIDFTGALATLNIAHQWWTWTRNIEKHSPGSDTLFYPKDIVGLCGYGDGPEPNMPWMKTGGWEDDQFYLSGKLEALDVPTEWFLDTKTKTLYLYCPNGDSPENHIVKYKKRTYAFLVKKTNHVELKGIDFFAATFRLEESSYCLVENCRLLFPVYSRRITEFDPVRTDAPSTLVLGSHNTIRKVSLAYSSTNGLLTKGSYNVVENCIIHDSCFSGTLSYCGLYMVRPDEKQYPEMAQEEGFGNIARKNTIYNCGNAVLFFVGKETLVEYNHLYNGGLACKDISILYSAFPGMAGSVMRYNWVHGVYTDKSLGMAGDRGGIGIRLDQYSRKGTIHHNVVWNCGEVGIIPKGDYHKVYNNTVFNIGTKPESSIGILMLDVNEIREFAWWFDEGLKRYTKEWPLRAKENSESLVFNNAAVNIFKDRQLHPSDLPPSRMSNNYKGLDLQLEDPAKFNFVPKKDSPLVDAGKVAKGLVENYKGKAPDIGAYERGEKRWVAGADWEKEYQDYLCKYLKN